jgi:hypothetical protein
MEKSYKHGNEFSVPQNAGNFRERLSACHLLLKKDSAPWML